MVSRLTTESLLREFFGGRVLVLLGARQVGKTTILEALQSKLDFGVLYLNADEPDERAQLTNTTSAQLKRLIGNHKVVIIDEAQRIPNIGLTVKQFADKLKDVQLIVTGSSSLELANTIKEPLTGRKLEYKLYPLSMEELVAHHGAAEERRMLESRLIFGSYPAVVTAKGRESEILTELASSYLYKDVFTFQEVRRPDLIDRLLQALALQICSEVSYHELAQIIHADPVTVERYIQLLEETFVIYRLFSLSRNHRNELKKSRKVYFYDNGVRNAIISNFNPLNLRDDAGKLWENYLMSERMKYLSCRRINAKRYFWRTRQQQEVDYVEERNGKLYAFEFKWKPHSKAVIPRAFLNAYPGSIPAVVDRDNFGDFLLPGS